MLTGTAGIETGIGIVSRPGLGINTARVGRSFDGNSRGEYTFAVVQSGEDRSSNRRVASQIIAFSRGRDHRFFVVNRPGVGDANRNRGIETGIGIVSRPGLGINTARVGRSFDGNSRGEYTFAVVQSGEDRSNNRRVASQIIAFSRGRDHGLFVVNRPGVGDANRNRGIETGIGIVSRPGLGVSTAGVGRTCGGNNRREYTFAVIQSGEDRSYNRRVATKIIAVLAVVEITGISLSTVQV